MAQLISHEWIWTITIIDSAHNKKLSSIRFVKQIKFSNKLCGKNIKDMKLCIKISQESMLLPVTMKIWDIF